MLKKIKIYLSIFSLFTCFFVCLSVKAQQGSVAASDEAQLRAALANPSFSVINITSKELTITNVPLTVSRDIKFISEHDTCTLKVAGDFRHIFVSSADKVTLEFEKVELMGRGISVGDNEISGGGIGVANEVSKLTLINAVIKSCICERGGALASGSDVEILGNNTLFSGNTAKYGGAINANNIVMEGGVISRNQAESGGGIYCNGRIFLNNGIIMNNRVQRDGAGIYAAAEFHMSDGTIIDNEARGKGGGVFMQDSASISGGTIDNNVAVNGGGIYTNSTLPISGYTQITGNSAEVSGGGIYIQDIAGLTVEAEVVFSDNSAGAPYEQKEGINALHKKNIATVSFTLPFKTLYNNADVSFLSSNAKEQQNSNTSNNKDRDSTAEFIPPKTGDLLWGKILLLIAAVTGIVLVVRKKPA